MNASIINLDSSILIWVLIPITITMTLAGIMNTYLNQSTSQHSPTTSRHWIKHESVLNLSRRFRAGYLLLTPHIYQVYQTHLMTSLSFGISEAAALKRQQEYENDGDSPETASSDQDDTDPSQVSPIQEFLTDSSDDESTSAETETTPRSQNNTSVILNHDQSPEENDIDPNLPNDEILDPTSMVNGMFSSILTILPQMLQFLWITFFFSGFVVARLPVSLSAPIPTNLKAMFHHSIPHTVSSELPVVYISGVSWYVLNLLGLSGFKAIVMDILKIGTHSSFRRGSNDDEDDDSESIMYQQTVGMSLPRHDAFQQLNPLAIGANGDGGQFKHDYKSQLDACNLLDYNSNTLVYSQQELLTEWRRTKKQKNLAAGGVQKGQNQEQKEPKHKAD